MTFKFKVGDRVRLVDDDGTVGKNTWLVLQVYPAYITHPTLYLLRFTLNSDMFDITRPEDTLIREYFTELEPRSWWESISE